MINCQRLFKTSIALLGCSVLLATTSFAQPKDLNNKLQDLSTKVGIPGMQITHFKDGKAEHYTFGVKHVTTKAPVNQQTAFQAASLTKVVTAYVFLRLMDQGLIDLDTPLWNYYAYDRLASTPNKELITARMVLTHRTGLKNWEGDVPTDAWRATPLTLLFTPGTSYAYSGEGFYFLQETMEQLSGKSFQQLVETEMLHPLGLRHSEIVWKEKLAENAAFGHYKGLVPRTLGKYIKPNAAYTLYTSAEDYTNFIQRALINGEGLTAASHQLLLTKQSEAQLTDTPSPADAFVPCALGLRMQLNELGTAVWHTGSNPGFRCFFIAYPESKESLAVFMNTETGFQAMGDLLALFLDNKQTFWAYEWRKGELD